MRLKISEAIATSTDREQAGRLVDLALAEYAHSIGQPVKETPELRQVMLWLAWQACKIEREAQESIRSLAVEEEREACAQIAEKAIRYSRREIAEAIRTIRARSRSPVEVAADAVFADKDFQQSVHEPLMPKAR